jgi:hypothetical protein
MHAKTSEIKHCNNLGICIYNSRFVLILEVRVWVESRSVDRRSNEPRLFAPGGLLLGELGAGLGDGARRSWPAAPPGDLARPLLGSGDPPGVGLALPQAGGLAMMISCLAADGIGSMTIPRMAMAATALGAAALVGWAGAAPASVSAPRSPSPDLSHYLGQRLDWGACPADATDLTKAGAQCAQMTVPLDYSAPDGRSIKLAISRIKAKDRAHRRGILLTNPGGPGGPGLDYTALLRPAMRDAADRYDLIGFDPRFVGRSTPIYCGLFPASTADALPERGVRGVRAERA